MVRIHLPPPFENNKHLKRGAFFIFRGLREITAKAVKGMKCRGVAPSGSTARSDVREDFAQAKPQGNPSPTTIFDYNRLKSRFFCAQITSFTTIFPPCRKTVEGLALLHKYPTICPHLREKPLSHVRGAKMKCYCKERKGHWYFRMRVPKELHPYLPSEISYSIKGLDLETARFRCKLLGNRLRGIFEQAKYGVKFA